MPTIETRKLLSELVMASIYHGDCQVVRELENRLLDKINELFYLPDATRRQIFITDLVDTQGYVNRTHIVKAFKVTSVMATHDLRHWQLLNPNKVYYDTKLKRYQRRDF